MGHARAIYEAGSIGAQVGGILAEIGVPEETIRKVVGRLDESTSKLEKGTPPHLNSRHLGGAETAYGLAVSTASARWHVRKALLDMAQSLGDYQSGLKTFRDSMGKVDDDSQVSAAKLHHKMAAGGAAFQRGDFMTADRPTPRGFHHSPSSKGRDH